VTLFSALDRQKERQTIVTGTTIYQTSIIFFIINFMIRRFKTITEKFRWIFVIYCIQRIYYLAKNPNCINIEPIFSIFVAVPKFRDIEIT